MDSNTIPIGEQMANSASALHDSVPLWQSASALRLVKAEPKFPPLPLPLLEGIFQNGLPRGAMTEIAGRRSSGKTSVCLHVLAQATRRGEVCAIVDTCGNFHPRSAEEAGVELNRLIWIRCNGNSAHALRATDLLLHAGGFSVVCLDLCEVPLRLLQQIPLSYWYRFGRAVENTPTTVLVCSTYPQAKSSTSSNLEVTLQQIHWSGEHPSLLLSGIETAGAYRKTLRTAQKLALRAAI
ncbi:MAG: hypothetical protein ACJ74Y_18195 [Bryobacteraceae bacterium]